IGASDEDLEDLVERIQWLIQRCGAAGIERLVLPFLDDGLIRTAADEDRAIEVLRELTPEPHGVEIHLESGFAPGDYARFLERLEVPSVKVLYDTGNSTSLGFDVDEEMAAYGSRIGSVHLKDRRRGGGSVPLGTGDTDLGRCVRALLAADYRRDF